MPDANGRPTPQELRAALFVQPESLEDLHRWIKVYLGIDLPSGRVDPESTSSPMELVWELYHAAKENLPGYSEVLAYAARDSFKTFSAAIFEVLCIILLERSVAHMAAIEPQAKKSQQYLKKHINRPYIRDYVSSKNERTVEITRFCHSTTGQNLTKAEFEALPVADKDNYKEIKNYVQIIICTIQGANSEHVPIMIVDEVDVVENPDAYEEAKMIPAPIEGKMPITLYTSTRKYSWGLVQKEIDNQAESGLIIRHWNLIDVTHRCPESRHRPDLPKVNLFYSPDTLRRITYDDYKLLDPEEQKKYHAAEGFYGCLNNCRIFAACQGRLALLPPCKKCGDEGMCPGFPKPVEHTQNVFRKTTLEKAKAQLLCWKPSSEGLIYPNFSRDIHMKTAAQMAEIIDGEEREVSFSKADLIALLKDRGARFVAGIDHGFSHNFVVIVGAIIGGRLFIIDVFSQAELEISQKVEICRDKVKAIYDPDVWADTEAPGDNKTLKREAKLKIKEWVKAKGSVVDGISIIRWLLMPAMGRPDEAKLFLLRGDDGCELLGTRMTNYHWLTDAAGRLTQDPDDEEDDELDALRYIGLNTFAPKGRVSISEANLLLTPKTPLQDHGTRQYDPSTWMRQVIAEKTGIDYESEDLENPTPSSGKSGGFSWDL